VGEILAKPRGSAQGYLLTARHARACRDLVRPYFTKSGKPGGHAGQRWRYADRKL